jgi:transcriptional regulator with XRE-family HTH domain
VRELREEQGLSIGNIAEASQQSKGHLSSIERGLVNPTVGTVLNIAEALQISAIHVMCFGESELVKFVLEWRALPEKFQRKVITKLSRTLLGGVKLRVRGGPPPMSTPKEAVGADRVGDDAEARNLGSLGVRGA